MKRKVGTLLFAGAVLVSGLAIGGNIAYARTVKSYDTIVPRLGGSWISGTTIEKTSTTKGVNNNTANGGGHQKYTAITNSAGTEITEKKLMKTGQRVLLAYKKGEGDKGRKTRLKLQTRATNIVNTQSRGTWSPDER